jgi:hypothetical protein
LRKRSRDSDNVPWLPKPGIHSRKRKPVVEIRLFMKRGERGGWGYVGQNCGWLIRPIYDTVTEFYDGLAAVCLNGRWGFIDEYGAWVLAPRYSDVARFARGLAAVKMDGRWGLLDLGTGRLARPGFQSKEEAISHFRRGRSGRTPHYEREPRERSRFGVWERFGTFGVGHPVQGG